MRGLCGALLVLLTADVVGAAPLPRVGVAPVSVDPTHADDATTLEDAVARGLARGAVQVVKAAEVRSIAARAARSGLVCDAREAPCAARLAAFSGLDFIVVTRLRDDDGATAALTLIDGHDGATLRERLAPLQQGPDGTAAGVEATARALLEDAPVPGRLEVRGPPGAAIDVDGEHRGVAPLVLEPGAGRFVVNGRVVRVPAAGVAVVEAVDVTGRALDDPDADDRVRTALAVTAGVGASVALGAGIGAFVIAPDVERRQTYTARAWNDAVAAGQGLFAVALVGGAVAALGAGLWASFALGEPDAGAPG